MSEELELSTKKAILYARVSTNDKDQRVETQEREMRKFCKKNSIDIIGYYFDEQTGTTLIRKDLMAALMHIRMSEVHIDYLMVYDQSRLTRDEATKDIKKQLEGTGCSILYVSTGKVSDDSASGRIVEGITDVMNKEENRIRKEKTKLGMATRKLQGKHISRPAAFMFAEDIETAPKGRCILTAYDDRKTVTKVVSEKTLFDYAREGYSYGYVAKYFLGIPPSSLYYEMKPKDPSDPNCRNRGTRDRYTEYMRLYNEAVRLRKGLPSQRVENDEKKTSQRVVE